MSMRNQPPEPERPTPGGSGPSYFNLRIILISGFILLFSIALIHGVSAILYLFFSPPVAAIPTIAIPQPQLEVSPPQDLQILRATENAHLQGYAWIDQKGGVVRIPIDRAMQLLAERGFPVTPEPMQNPGGINPNESGLPHPTLGPLATPGPQGTFVLGTPAVLGTPTVPVTPSGTAAAANGTPSAGTGTATAGQGTP